MKEAKSTPFQKIMTVIGIIICAILVPILIINGTLIIKSYITDDVPSVGGILPQIVLSDSMANPDEPYAIYAGDLIICKTAKPEDIEVGDVISFIDPSGNGTSVVTHKVVRIEDGKWYTRGTNNNTDDRKPVPFENLIAKYEGFRIPGAGNIAIFMQTVPGLIICVLIPMILFVGYDIIRRRQYEKKNQQDTDLLMAELEALRAAKAQDAKASNTETENE